MTPEEVPAFVNRARGLMSELEALPQPVIAALDGVALGGGLEMALAADLRVASARARLGLTETRLAIIPGAGGTQRLPRLIGPAKAKELIFTARIVGGAEAAELGLVNRLADGSAEDAAYEAALEMAVEILPNGPIALKAAKLAINQGSEVDLASALQTEMLCYQMVSFLLFAAMTEEVEDSSGHPDQGSTGGAVGVQGEAKATVQGTLKH